MRRHFLLTALLIAISAAVPAIAGAHAVLLSTTPLTDSVLTTAPAAATLTFNEPVAQIGAVVQIIGPTGTRYETGAATVRNNVLTQRIAGRLPNGTATVVWTVISPDGHRVSGAFSFSVGAPSGTANRVDTPALERPRWSSTATTIMRATRFVTTLLFVGLIGVLLFVWGPLMRRGQSLDPDAAAGADNAVRPVLRRLAWVAPVALLAACLAYLPIEAWSDSITISDLLRLRQGQIAGVTALLALFSIPCSLRAAGDNRRAYGIAAGVAAVLLALMPGLSGHASAQQPAWPSVLLDWAHVLAAGVWGGGVIVLAIIAPSLYRATTPASRGVIVLGIVKRFTRLALGGLAVLVVTGAIGALILVGSISEIWQTPWGRVLIAKVSVVVLAVAIAGLTRRAAPSFLRAVQLEALLIIIVIALTGTLSGLAPQGSSSTPVTGPFRLEQRIDARIVNVDVVPGTVHALSDVHVIVVNDVGQPAVDVADATVTLSSPAQGITSLPVKLERVGAAHWAGKVTIPEPGPWTVTTHLRIGQFRDEVVVGTMTVSP